jgi:broad specificity phosphatase PhoE
MPVFSVVKLTGGTLRLSRCAGQCRGAGTARARPRVGRDPRQPRGPRRAQWRRRGRRAKMRAVLPDPTDFCRLWLCRQPELDADAAQRAIGDGPAELGRRGRAQVLRWLELLQPVRANAVWCGPQPQCHGPARALAEARQQEARVDARLRDQQLGRWQGRTWAEVMRDEEGAVRTFFAEFGEAKAPGGESLGDAVERLLGWWTSIAPGGAGQAHLVVLPGTLLGGFAAAMLGMRLARGVSLGLPAGGVGVLDVFENGVRVAAWNVDALRADAP